MSSWHVVLRRTASALLATGMAAIVSVGAGVVAAPVAAAAAACTDLAPGEPLVGNTNTSYTSKSGLIDVAGSRATVYLEGLRACEAPGSRFVRVFVRLWDGTGAVTAFLEQAPGGAVPGTAVTVDPSGFLTPAVSNIKNVSGQTVRACGHFVLNGASEVRCGEWVTVPGSTAPVDRAPIGYSDCDATSVVGWAKDPDWTGSLEIHLYDQDGFVKAFTADAPSEPGTQGANQRFAVPHDRGPGTVLTTYALGRDAGGAANTNNPALPRSDGSGASTCVVP